MARKARPPGTSLGQACNFILQAPPVCHAPWLGRDLWRETVIAAKGESLSARASRHRIARSRAPLLCVCNGTAAVDYCPPCRSDLATMRLLPTRPGTIVFRARARHRRDDAASHCQPGGTEDASGITVIDQPSAACGPSRSTPPSCRRCPGFASPTHVSRCARCWKRVFEVLPVPPGEYLGQAESSFPVPFGASGVRAFLTGDLMATGPKPLQEPTKAPQIGPDDRPLVEWPPRECRNRPVRNCRVMPTFAKTLVMIKGRRPFRSPPPTPPAAACRHRENNVSISSSNSEPMPCPCRPGST